MNCGNMDVAPALCPGWGSSLPQLGMRREWISTPVGHEERMDNSSKGE